MQIMSNSRVMKKIYVFLKKNIKWIFLKLIITEAVHRSLIKMFILEENSQQHSLIATVQCLCLVHFTKPTLENKQRFI